MINYWDNGSTTPIDSEINEKMYEISKKVYGNPSSKYHEQGRKSLELLKKSRTWFSDFFNIVNENIIFTSGATESNNMVLKGISLNYINQNKNIVISKFEHPSIYEQEKFLNKIGIEIKYFGHNNEGQISDFSMIDENTIFVSINHVNHDLGIIQKIENCVKEIQKKEKELKIKIHIHIDSVKYFGKEYYSNDVMNYVNSITISSHKINGPKGVGMLILKLNKNTPFIPILEGGEQENKLRAGTENVIAIYGFYLAAKKRYDNLEQYRKKIIKQQEHVTVDLKEMFGEYFDHLNVKNQMYGYITFFVKNNLNTTILEYLGSNKMMSNGSACSITKPSKTLLALNISQDKISEFIRVTL